MKVVPLNAKIEFRSPKETVYYIEVADCLNRHHIFEYINPTKQEYSFLMKTIIGKTIDLPLDKLKINY